MSRMGNAQIDRLFERCFLKVEGYAEVDLELDNAAQERCREQGCSSASLTTIQKLEVIKGEAETSFISANRVQSCVQNEVEVNIDSGNAKKTATCTAGAKAVEPDQHTDEIQETLGVAEVADLPLPYPNEGNVGGSTAVESWNVEDNNDAKDSDTWGKRGLHADFSHLGDSLQDSSGKMARDAGGMVEDEVEENSTRENVEQTDPAESTWLLQEQTSGQGVWGLRELRIDEGKSEVCNPADAPRLCDQTSRRPEVQEIATKELSGSYGRSNVNSAQVMEKVKSGVKCEAVNIENQVLCPLGQPGARSLGTSGHGSELENTWTPVSKIQPTSVITFLLSVGDLPSPVQVKLANCALLVEESEAATEVVKDILASHQLSVRRLEGTRSDDEGMQPVEMRTEQGNDVTELLVEFGLVQPDPEQLFSGQQGKVHRFMQGEWRLMWKGEVFVVRCQGGFLLKVESKDASNVLFDSRLDKLLWTKVKTRKFYWTKEAEGREKEQWVVVLTSNHEVKSLCELMKKFSKSLEDNMLDVQGEVEHTVSATGKQEEVVYKHEEVPGVSGSLQQLEDCDLLARESKDLAMPGLKGFPKSSLQGEEDKEEIRIVSPVELEDPASFSTCIPGIGGRLKVRLLHIDPSSSNFFVCGEKEWGELITFQEELQEQCRQFHGNPVEPLEQLQPLQLVVFCSSQDLMWYRGIVKKVHKGSCKLFCPDYGFTEKVNFELPLQLKGTSQFIIPFL